MPGPGLLGNGADRAHKETMSTPTDTPAEHLTLQFLVWVAAAPRTYGDAMEAWQSTCPRMTIWEDAVSAGLVDIRSSGKSMRLAEVVLTALGHARLRAGAAAGEQSERTAASGT
jgi:hypothetical protein